MIWITWRSTPDRRKIGTDVGGVAENPGNGPIAVSFADMLRDQGDPGAATSILEKRLEVVDSEHRKELLKKLAEVFADQCETEKAKQTIDRYCEENRDDQWALAATGKFYRDRLGLERGALAFFNQLAEKHPKYSTGHQEALATLLQLGDLEEAERVVTRYNDLLPDQKDRVKRECSTLAKAFLFRGKPEKTLGLVDDLLARAPDAEHLHYDRARALCLMGRKEEALKELKGAMSHYFAILARTDGCFKSLWNDDRFGEITRLDTVNRKVLKERIEEMEAEPRMLVKVLRVIQQYRRLGEYEKALSRAQRSVERIGTFYDRDQQECWIYDEMGRTYDQLGDWSKLNEAYRAGIQAVGIENNRVVNILINHGSRLISQGRYAEALDRAEKATAVETSAYGNVQMQEVKCLALHGLGKTSLHVKVLKAMEANHSADPLSLVDVFLDLGKKDEAARMYVHTLADPRYRDRALIMLQDYKWKAKKGVSLRPSESHAALRSHPEVPGALKGVGRITEVEAYAGY